MASVSAFIRVASLTIEQNWAGICELSNNLINTTAQLHSSHASKAVLKILQARLQQCVNQELPDVQACFRKKRRIRDQIAIWSNWIIKKARGFQKNIYFCFIDYAKDCVDHNKLQKIIQEMDIKDHFTCLLRNLYADKEATVRTRHGTMDWFQIGSCILLPCLLNLYAEDIMWNAGLDEAQAGIKIARRNINNLSYADDTTLMAESDCYCEVTSVVSNSVWPQRRQPTRLPHPWDSPGKNTGVGCHFCLQWMKVKSESEVAQSCPTLSDPMDCSLPGSSIHGIF